MLLLNFRYLLNFFQPVHHVFNVGNLWILFLHSLTRMIALKKVDFSNQQKFTALLSLDWSTISSTKKEIIKWRKEQLMIMSVAVKIAVRSQ